MVVRMVGRLVGRMVGPSVGRMVGMSVGRMVGRLFCHSFVRSVRPSLSCTFRSFT